MKKLPTTTKLLNIIEEQIVSPYQRMLYIDAFACGCYLHLKGQKDAGYKMCRTVLLALGFDRRKIYFDSLLNGLEGREEDFVSGLNAHCEISELFYKRKNSM